MLRKYSNSRTLKDNLQLGSLTAFSAGMVNVISVILFFAFTSNVTGHYAILAEEIAKGNYYQAAVVLTWIFLFFMGSFTSNWIIITFNKVKPFLAHATPVVLEIICLLLVGSYVQFFYQETLLETEFMVGLMLYAMGLQNGLTATISNSTVKTTHLTGLTTDLGMLFSMFTKKEFRNNQSLRDKAKIQMAIMTSYLSGGIASGLIFLTIGYNVFYIVCLFLVFIILYDHSKLKVAMFARNRQMQLRESIKPEADNRGKRILENV